MRVWETEIQAETNDTSAVAMALNMTTKLGTRGQKRETATLLFQATTEPHN
jgi:hypothetical protein